MFRFFKKRFMNLKIRQKIAISMVCLALLTALVVGVFCSVSFEYLYKEQSNSQMDNTLDVTILSIDSSLNSMYRSTTYMLSNTLFSDIYRATGNGGRDPDFLYHYGLVQDYFSSYLRSNSLADGIVLLCAGGDIYSTYESGLNYTIGNFSDELAQTSISWLHERINPLAAGNTQVIPVCFPLSYQPGLFLSNGKKASMVLVVYLNVDRLALSMEQTNRTAFSRVYLSDSTGFPLTVKQSDQMYKKLSDISFRNRLANSEQRVHFMTSFDRETYSVATEEVGVSGLRIVSIVSYGKMLQDLHKIQQTTLAAVSLSFLLALLLAAGLSSTITTPIKRLLCQVDKMRAGDYALKPVTKYNDEIHTLDGALCDMSLTVVEQMENIKRTEELRRKAELLSLTEQISPHFLYNTLDCIHWEILGGQQKTAASMIESLGIFLRLSLNHGCEMLDLPEVIEHTQQYVNIMNYRFKTRICFTFSVSPDLMRFKVPKMILQPLAENSIFHGFGGQQPDPGIKDPTISVTARQQEDRVVIIMEDNGRGIDTVQAAESLLAPVEINPHVGLHNVYQRLMNCFGPEVKIQFSSIPYYKNEVTLILPRSRGSSDAAV